MDRDIPAGARPRLSLCMIVKDEQRLLPLALQSAMPWVDEVVVVDTGSTDRTPEIARRMGARVFHDPWQGDFSLHRNRCLELAGGEWILVLDADEELDQESAPLLARAMGDPEAEGYLLEVVNDLPGGAFSTRRAARLFRNLPHIRYQGRIHEQPSLSREPARLGVSILHRGYNLDPQTMARKSAQRLPMLVDWVEAEPNAFAAHLHLANHLLAEHPGREQEALDHALNAFRLVQVQDESRNLWPRVLNTALLALDRLGMPGELFRMAKACEELFPAWPDPLFAQVLGASVLENWREVCRAARRFLALQKCWRKNPQEYPYSLNMTQDKQQSVLYHWVLAAAHLGMIPEAALAYQRLESREEWAGAARAALDQLRESGLAATAARLDAEGFKQAAG